MFAAERWKAAGGLAMIGVVIASIPFEYAGNLTAYDIASVLVVIGLASFFPVIPWSRRIFVLIGLALLVLSALTLADWQTTAADGLHRASFIAAFFTALTCIRSAAAGSPAITDCGRFLAGQPPGRRYLALTLGGHMFGLVLMYGSISLLGGLASESAKDEQNAEIRGHRLRRMLVAIQRGFISTLAWSPLAFSMAISLTLVPGARWSDAALPCLISALVLVVTGWALDTIFKPKLSVPSPPRGPAEGHWIANLRPLLILLAVVITVVATMHFAFDVRIVGVVMSTIPIIALVWVATQKASPGQGHLAHTADRARHFATKELPAFGPELVLLSMAGFIGTVGSSLAAPVMAASGIDLTVFPAQVLLVAIFWLIPLAGQLGMNPILSVSLLAPLLPTPDALGVAPAAIIVAITGGWAVCAATSPFTASTLLIGNFGKVSAVFAGLRWNGPFALTSGLALSAWVVVASYLL